MQPRLRQLDFQRLRCQQRADARFVQSFRAKFGPPADVLVCVGDWDERHTSGLDSTHMNLKHFEPTKGVGLLRLLQRAGYTVLLVAESYTSKRCYACEAGEVHTFRMVRCRVWVLRALFLHLFRGVSGR